MSWFRSTGVNLLGEASAGTTFTAQRCRSCCSVWKTGRVEEKLILSTRGKKKTMLLVRCSQLYNPNISSFFDKSQAHGTCHWWALLSFHSLLNWLDANKVSDDVHLYWVVQLHSPLPQPSHKKRAGYAKGLTLFFRFIGGRRVPSLKAKICSLPWKENNPPFLSQFSADFWLSSLFHLEAILQCEQGNSQ